VSTQAELVQLVCSASVLLCVVVFVVVATLEASDWLVFCSCKPSLALLQSIVNSVAYEF
jgi:hypothetical protein